MAYQALYRKWRPMVFDDVIGQQHITETIKNEIIGNKISHAYLFTGTRGTGKTSMAKIFSRAVNCLNPQNGNPCNECDICKGILSERVLDVVEIDAASNTGVDNIRDIIEQTKYATAQSKYRVYIIDEVHMLSDGAFNALLKTLEEPAKGVIFILATTEIHKVPATIMSRCQRFDFKTINVTDIVSRIKYILKNEGIFADDEALEYVAQLGDGSMRDALSILDQCLAFKENDLTYADVVDTVGAIDDTFLYNIAYHIAGGRTSDALETFQRCVADGKNTDYFAQGLMQVFRATLLYKISGNLEYTGLKSANVEKTAEVYTVEKLMYCVDIITKLLNDIKFSSSPKVYIEMALIKMATPELDDSNAAVLARISQLEKDLKSGKIATAVKNVPDENDFSGDDVNDLPWDEMPPIGEYITPDDPEPEQSAEEISDVNEQPTSAGTNADTVCNNWAEIENAVMSDGAITLYMAIRNVKPRVSKDGALQIVCENAEARDNLTKDENKLRIECYIRNVFGFDLQPEYLTVNQVEDTAGSVSAPEKVDFFGKIEQFSKDFPENIEMYEN